MSVKDDDEVHWFLFSSRRMFFVFNAEKFFLQNLIGRLNASQAVVETTCFLLSCERKDSFK